MTSLSTNLRHQDAKARHANLKQFGCPKYTNITQARVILLVFLAINSALDSSSPLQTLSNRGHGYKN